MTTVRQTSFAAGELSPYMYGRTDLELFAHGARKILNFIVNKQGNVVSRAGTRKVADCPSGTVILVPYLHASGDSYIIELTHLWMRDINLRTLAIGGSLPTVFRGEDLAELQYCQNGSTLTLTHQSRVPQEITYGTSGFTINPVRFEPRGETDYTPVALTANMPSIAGNPPALPVLVAWQPTSLFVVDAAHPPREWRYKVSTIVRHIYTGETFETLPVDITQYVEGDVSTGTVPIVTGSQIELPTDNLLVLYPDAPIYIAPGLGTEVTNSTLWVTQEYVYYRGRGSVFGLIGTTRSNSLFADFGAEPDYLTPPLRGESPFRTGEHPAAVAFFQQRRCLAGSGSRPNTWWSSAVDAYTNHDEPVLNWPGQPLEATLLGRKRETIVSMVCLEHLFIFTDTSVWQVGRDDVPLDYDTMPAVTRVIDEVGSKRIGPLVVDGTSILYPRASGRGIRALHANQNGSGSFVGGDASWHAEHLFRGASQDDTGSVLSHSISSWCFQREPYGIAWMVRTDGALISCTRTGQDTWAWAKHDVGGKVYSVMAAPTSIGELSGWDNLVLVVERAGQKRIEIMTPIDVRGLPLYATDENYIGNPIGSLQLTYPLDSYITATITKATGTTVTGLDHLNGKDVWLSCPGIDPVGPLCVVSGSVTTPIEWGPTGATTFIAAIGLPFTCDLELLDARPGSTGQKTVTAVGFEVDNAQGVEVGEDFDALTPWRSRNVSGSYEYPSAASALVVVRVNGSWRRTGRAAIRQAKPLPLTILGVTRELSEGGK